MERATVQRVLNQGKDMGADNPAITGGDPLTLEPDYLENMIRHATNMGLETWVFTNAQSLVQKTAELLVRWGVRRIVTSLYGRSPKVHDEFTGVSGSHERTPAGIRSAGNAGLQVIVATVVTRRTLEEVKALSDLPAIYGVDGIQFSSPVPTGRAKDMTDSDLSKEAAIMRGFVLLRKGLSCRLQIR
jgi:MoaA/NifB/PqqE/SkfB family radical SAM enzyme